MSTTVILLDFGAWSCRSAAGGGHWSAAQQPVLSAPAAARCRTRGVSAVPTCRNRTSGLKRREDAAQCVQPMSPQSYSSYSCFARVAQSGQACRVTTRLLERNSLPGLRVHVTSRRGRPLEQAEEGPERAARSGAAGPGGKYQPVSAACPHLPPVNTTRRRTCRASLRTRSG